MQIKILYGRVEGMPKISHITINSQLLKTVKHPLYFLKAKHATLVHCIFVYEQEVTYFATVRKHSQFILDILGEMHCDF